MKYLLLLFISVLLSIADNVLPYTKINDNNSEFSKTKKKFEVVGYLFVPPGDAKVNLGEIAYQYLTTINYAFALPAADNSGDIMEIPHPDVMRNLVSKAHSHGVKAFVSVGGFDIGDGPGIDMRFEMLANKASSRTNFAHNCMSLVRKFNLDGIDIDWEFPDAAEPSSSDYVKLMKELRDSLHPAHKKLTAAVESHHLPYGYGIEKEVFQYVDWLNIMGYDNETFGSHRPHGLLPHSPYWLDEISFDYWINQRGLPKDKAVMGVPFYGKGFKVHMNRFGSYRELLAQGADPYSDVFDSVYYNGITTMKRKAKLAMKRGAGIMIWELTSDTTGKYSLLKAINDAIKENEAKPSKH